MHAKKLEQVLSDKQYAISDLRQRLERYDNEIQAIHAETHANDERMALVVQKQTQADKNPRNIAAEDAFDTVMRLESTSKIVDKRNAVLEKDNAARKKKIADAGKMLQKLATEESSLIEVTGFHPDKAPTPDSVDQHRQNNDKAAQFIVSLQKELHNGELVIKQKQSLIQQLTSEIEGCRDRENELCQIYNDIRVADRDCKDAMARLEAQKAEFQKINTSEKSLVEANGRQMAVSALEADNVFLRSEIRRHKLDTQRQEKVTSAQLARTRQLQARLDCVIGAIQDMKLGADLERSISKDAAVPASQLDAEDTDRILPPNEVVPVELYELLHRDCEVMRSIADRKFIIVTEKSCARDAQAAKLEGLGEQMQLIAAAEDDARKNGQYSAEEGFGEFSRQHEEYRGTLRELVTENTRLKALCLQLQQQQQQQQMDGSYA